MRDLEESNENELVIDDTISESKIKLFYRQPTTEERVRYQQNLWERKGKKVLVNAEMRLGIGLKILTGFREGDFGYAGKPISSDPKSPNYRADWKELLKKTSADIVIALAVAVFEGIGMSAKEEEEDEEELPLAKSSEE